LSPFVPTDVDVDVDVVSVSVSVSISVSVSVAVAPAMDDEFPALPASSLVVDVIAVLRRASRVVPRAVAATATVDILAALSIRGKVL
jgi:hypothetical protein